MGDPKGTTFDVRLWLSRLTGIPAFEIAVEGTREECNCLTAGYRCGRGPLTDRLERTEMPAATRFVWG